MDGTTLNYIDPIPDGNGLSFTDTVLGTEPNTVTYKVQSQTYVDADGVLTTKSTGVMYRVDSVHNQAKWVEIVPGAASVEMSAGAVSGTTSTGKIGVTVDGQHNDAQLTGGISNRQTNRVDALEGLIRSVKDTATKFAYSTDLSTVTTNDGTWGTATNPAIVYITYRKNADGTVSEGDMHLSGPINGYGIMVVEIDDPNKAQFVMSGQSTWTGLTIIVVNKVPTVNKQPLSFVGGGQDLHIIGGTFVYMRNQKRDANDTSTLIGDELVKLAGNGNIRYSSMALDNAFKMKPSAMQVRSWRRLQENE
jgi:hypothetical protein